MSPRVESLKAAAAGWDRLCELTYPLWGVPLLGRVPRFCQRRCTSLHWRALLLVTPNAVEILGGVALKAAAMARAAMDDMEGA